MYICGVLPHAYKQQHVLYMYPLVYGQGPLCIPVYKQTYVCVHVATEKYVCMSPHVYKHKCACDIRIRLCIATGMCVFHRDV